MENYKIKLGIMLYNLAVYIDKRINLEKTSYHIPRHRRHRWSVVPPGTKKFITAEDIAIEKKRAMSYNFSVD